MCRLSTSASSQRELEFLIKRGLFITSTSKRVLASDLASLGWQQLQHLLSSFLNHCSVSREQRCGLILERLAFFFFSFFFTFIYLFLNQVKEMNARSEWIYLKGSSFCVEELEAKECKHIHLVKNIIRTRSFVGNGAGCLVASGSDARLQHGTTKKHLVQGHHLGYLWESYSLRAKF